MKKLFTFVIVVLLLAFALQTFTDFKAIDHGLNYIKNINWQAIKEKLPNLSLGSKNPSPDKQLNIFIRNDKFTPNFNALAKGARVSWFNEDIKVHTVTSNGWDSGNITAGAAYSRVFDAAGEYSYHCSIHPNMTGKIIVK